MSKEDSGRRFSRELKPAALQRMALGANVSRLARELGVSRKSLYQWQKRFRVAVPPLVPQLWFVRLPWRSKLGFVKPEIEMRSPYVLAPHLQRRQSCFGIRFA